MNEPLISVENISFAYQNSKSNVFEKINFSLCKGEIISFLGPNGVGKSTLLKIIGGYLKPNKGKVYLKGKDISSYSPSDLACIRAHLPQEVYVHFPFKVEEVIAMGRELKKILNKDKKDAEIIEKVMTLTNVTHLKGRRITQLSGGEKKKVFLAQVLAQEPEILLLDEPFVYLDIKHKLELVKLLKFLNQQHQMSIIFISNEIGIASQLTDKLFYLSFDGLYSGLPIGDALHKIFEVEEKELILHFPKFLSDGL